MKFENYSNEIVVCCYYRLLVEDYFYTYLILLIKRKLFFRRDRFAGGSRNRAASFKVILSSSSFSAVYHLGYRYSALSTNILSSGNVNVSNVIGMEARAIFHKFCTKLHIYINKKICPLYFEVTYFRQIDQKYTIYLFKPKQNTARSDIAP